MNAITIERDDLNADKHLVCRGDDVLGVVLDEHGVIATRGRFHAWSPKGGGRNGSLGFFPTRQEAVDAITAAHGIVAEEQPQRSCTPVAGGAVHDVMPGTGEEDPFPFCRTGAATNAGTRYRLVTGEPTCKTCLTYRSRRAAA